MRYAIKALNGIIDGSNRVFYAEESFTPGTIVVFINGVCVKEDNDDGWEETGWNEVTLKEAPIVGDVVSAAYRPL